METLLDFVKANPLYAAGAAALLLLVIVALVKKALKLAVIALALNVGYGYYLNDLAREYYRQAQKAVAVAGENAKVVTERYESAQETVDKAGDLFDQAGRMMGH